VEVVRKKLFACYFCSGNDCTTAIQKGRRFTHGQKCPRPDRGGAAQAAKSGLLESTPESSGKNRNGTLLSNCLNFFSTRKQSFGVEFRRFHTNCTTLTGAHAHTHSAPPVYSLPTLEHTDPVICRVCRPSHLLTVHDGATFTPYTTERHLFYTARDGATFRLHLTRRSNIYRAYRPHTMERHSEGVLTVRETFGGCTDRTLWRTPSIGLREPYSPRLTDAVASASHKPSEWVGG
jgi:hypothetical protein